MTLSRSMRAVPEGLVLLLVALAILLGGAGRAQARVVGIVFDDSGSMSPRVQLPAFGVELLVSSLDGRPGQDRLLALRLSEAQGFLQRGSATVLADQPIDDSRQLQGAIDRIRGEWTRIVDGTPTPYAAIDLMLRSMTATLKPGEEGFLLIVSDGGFNDPPRPEALPQIYEAYKSEIARKGARLRVDFLLIAFPDRDEIVSVVDTQKVRSTLLEVFNGSATDGQRDVYDIGDLLAALKGVIAKVSGTAENLADLYVRKAGPVLTIESPLAISRIVSVATERDARLLPHLRDTSFAGASSAIYRSRMDRADMARGAGGIEVGETTQILPSPHPFYAGTQRLTFDRPVGDDVMLVFQTAARVVLDLVTDKGAAVPLDAQRRRVLASGGRYRLVATLMDETPRGPEPVSLASLRGRTSFQAKVEGSGGPQPLPMDVDVGTNHAVADFTAGPPGEGSARGEVTLEGFVTTPSEPVRFIVLDGATTFEAAVHGLEPCPGCGAGTIGAAFDSTRQPKDMAEVTVTPRGRLSGTAKLDRNTMPAWVEVLDGSGRVLSDGDAIPLVPDSPVRLKLRRAGTLPATINGARVPFAFALKTDPPLAGEGRVHGDINISVVPAMLRFRAHNGVDDGSGRPVVAAQALVDRSVDLAFDIGGTLTSPKADDFAVSFDGRLVQVGIEKISPGGIVLRPRTAWWCPCFLWLEAGPHRVVVDYTGPGGLQTAQAQMEIVIAPTLREVVVCLAYLVLFLLTLVWLVGIVVVVLRTTRFPKGSVAEVNELRENHLPRYIDLRGRNLTLAKAMLWPLRRLWGVSIVPNERRLVEGMTVVARRGGYSLKIDDGMALEVRGHDVADLLAVNPKLGFLRMNWREELTLHGPPTMRVRFMLALSEVSEPV